MKNIKLLSYLLLTASFALTGCFKDELPIPPPPPSDIKSATAEMGPYYANQIYWDLGTNKAVKTNSSIEWDIALDSDPDSFYVHINYSRVTKIFDLGEVNFDTLTAATVNALQSSDFTCDAPDGLHDSTAVGQWWSSNQGGTLTSKNHVYIAYEIQDEKGLHFRRKKFMIEGFSGGKYKIRFADPDNSNSGTIEVPKDPTTETVNVSFDSGGSYKSLEPPMQDWDICFTRFTESLWDGSEFLWYSVVTPIVNWKYNGVAIDSVNDFKLINRDSIPNYIFEYRRNSIGHTWKDFSLVTNRYTVKPNLVFILNDVQGFYYKLHFIGFYNDTGDKGYPKFELQRL